MTDFLISTTGLSARIHKLPGREPFMLAADLADCYGTEYRRLTEAVKRNPDRFPEDFAFFLTPEEVERLPKNAATSPGQRTDLRPLVCTHAGAIALSGVLKTAVAAKVSVTIHRAFARMERQAFDQMRFQLLAAQIRAKASSGTRVKLIDGAQSGMTFEAIAKMVSASRPKLADIARECLAMGLIDRLPPGTPEAQTDLFLQGI